MSDNSQNNRQLARNTIFLYARMVLVLLVSLYTTRVILNALGFVDYGIYNVVAGFVSMFAFINNTMAIGIQRFYNYEAGANNGISQSLIYTTAIQIQVLIALLVCILLESAGIWYINNVLVVPESRLFASNWVFQCSVISLVFVILQVPYSALIMAREKFDFYALVSFVDVILKLAIVFILPHISGDKLIFYGFLSLTINLITLFLYFAYCKLKFSDARILKVFNREQFQLMLSFSGWNALDMFANTLKTQGLNLLLNAFFGPIVNAARAISTQVMGALQGFSMNIVTAFRPQLIESYAKGEYNRTRSLMYSESKISYILLLALSLPIVIEMKFIFGLWLGTVPEYTIPFTILVLVNMLVSSLNTPLSQTVQAVGKLKTYQIVRGAVVSAIIPLSWITLKLGADAITVFWVSLVITIINQPVSMILLKRVFEYSYKEYILNVILPCLLLTVLVPILPLTVSVILSEGWIRLIVIVILSIALTVILGYWFLLNFQEKQFAKTFLISFIHKFKK